MKEATLKRFPIGQLVATSGVVAFMDDNPERRAAVLQCLKRHMNEDWGDVDSHDQKVNDEAVKHGYRILSAYKVDDTKIWIITEADRSATTILFPDEY